MKKNDLLQKAIIFILTLNIQVSNAEDNTVTQKDSTGISLDSLQKMSDKELKAYFDSIYLAGHPRLDTICNKEKPESGIHPIKQQTNFSYSNSYVPNSASISTSKAVGQIDIQPGVSPTGAKTYTVPIKSYFHDGVFCPDISFSYNSQGGGSYAGKGWSIGGLQVITRGSKSTHYDGKAEGMKNNPDDAFYLNGVRLIRTSTTGYEYKSEQGNIKAVASVSGNITNNFTVYYPNGYKGIFGPSSTNINNIEYPLYKMYDERGRQIRFSYDFNNYQYYITSIQYDNLQAKIEFVYDNTRADYVHGYRGGHLTDSRKLLRSVTCSRDNTTLGTYTLTYTVNDSTSLLSRIDYAANGSSLNPLKFYYGDGSAQAAYIIGSQSYTKGYEYNYRNELTGVRGRIDYYSGDDALFVYPANTSYFRYSNGGSTNYFENKHDANKGIYAYCHLNEFLGGVMPDLYNEEGFIDLLCADLEGNQRECVIKVNNTVYNNYDRLRFKVYVYNAATGLSLYKNRTYDFSTLYTDGAGHKSIQPKFYYTGDFNGDGKMEILAVSAENPLGESTRPSKCYIFDLISGAKLYEGHVFSFHKEFPTSANLIAPENNSDKVLAIDVNGDGKTEVCHVSSSGTNVYSFQSENGSWTVSCIGSGNLPTTSSFYNCYYSCGDFNGDGLVDIIASETRGYSSTYWTLYYAKGDGTFTFKYIQGPNMSSSADSDFLVQDIDGDGITDLVELTSTQMKSYIIKNNYVNLKSTISLPHTNEFLVPVRINSSTISYQFVGIHGYNASLFSYKTNQSVDQALTGVVNSHGVIDKNYYYSISKDNYGIYTKYTTASFPYSNLYEGLPVLAGNEVFLNGSSKDINKYFYENAVLNRQGMGFRGFEKIKTQNKRGQFSTTTFEPTRYCVIKEIDTPAFKTTNTNNVTVESNKTVKALVTEKTEWDKLKNVIGNISYTYDNTYGLVLTEHTELPGNIVVDKTYTYNNTNNSSKYHLGVLASSSVKTRRGSYEYTESNHITSFNTNDQPLTIINKVNGQPVKTTTLTYDSSGNVTSEKVKPYSSTVERISNYTYTTGNRMTMATDPVGVYKSFIYNTDGTVNKTTTYVGNTEYTYDAFRRITKEKYPDNTEQNISYTWDSGNGGIYAITKTGTNIPTVKTVYDAFNREVRTITTRFDGTQTKVAKIYDNYGNISQESLPYKNSATIFKLYAYDAYNRLTQKTEAGKTTTYTYNNLNTTVSDGTMSTTTTEDALGGVVSITNPAGTTTYTLNGAGNPIYITTPATSGTVTTTISYDVYGRRITLNDPNHGTSSYEYDTAGNLKKATDSKLDTLSYLYDNYGRLTRKASSEFYTTYTYNNNLNNLTAATSSNGTSTTYTYDNLGRLSSTQETGIDSKWLKKDYTYSNGKVSSLKYTSQSGILTTENYTYANGYLKEVKLNGVTSIFKLTSENNLGQTSCVTTGPLTRNYAYTNYGYPSSRSVTGNSQTYQSWTYSFNATTGNLSSRNNTKNGISENFTYDNLHRLTSYAGTSVGYDNNGNITSKGDVGTFSYMTSKPYAIYEATLTNSISVGTQNISYFTFDRPNTITDNGYTISYTYNGNFDRVKKRQIKNGNVKQRYYLGGCYELDSDVNGSKERLYLCGDYYSAPAVLIKNGSSSSVYYILRDHLGSITHVINSSGAVVQELSYDAWGRLRNPSNNTIYAPASEPEPYLGRGYCGHEHITGVGLINMNARLYDPLLGRFLSPDPYVQAPEYSQSFNRYSYCLNNPLIYKDEDGEFLHLIIGAVIGGIVNVIANAKNISSFWQGVGYFGIGAVAGSLSAGVGSGVNVAMAGGSFGAGFIGTAGGISSTGFISGALAGSSSGFVGGFITNSGNSWMSGSNFGEGLWNGIRAGGIGALTGGAIGGVVGGIDAVIKGTNFWTGTKNIDLSQYAASGFIPDELKAKIIRAKYVGEFEDASVFEAKWMGERGATVPDVGIIVGKGTYTSADNMGRDLLQHEYGHVLQYKKIGPKAYYSVIAPESVVSAARGVSYHNSFWTETWANFLSKQYFGAEWLGGKWNRIAQPLSTFNAIRLVIATIFL